MGLLDNLEPKAQLDQQDQPEIEAVRDPMDSLGTMEWPVSLVSRVIVELLVQLGHQGSQGLWVQLVLMVSLELADFREPLDKLEALDLPVPQGSREIPDHQVNQAPQVNRAQLDPLEYQDQQDQKVNLDY